MNAKNALFRHTLVAAVALSTACGAELDAPPAESAKALTVTTDFSIGIAVADFGSAQAGEIAFTPSVEGGGGVSAWACDADCFDPDSARLEVQGSIIDDVGGKDFRVCIQAADGRTLHTNAGAFACTNWASQGTSTSGMATDADGYDPDSFRVMLETRPWPNGVDQAREVKFRIRAWDKAGGQIYYPGAWSAYTGTNTVGGGSTGFTTGPFTRDPDGFEIEMHVAETSFYGFCSPAHRCQHGFGDCDSNADCVSGTKCVQDVGTKYGYTDPSIDVCVD